MSPIHEHKHDLRGSGDLSNLDVKEIIRLAIELKRELREGKPRPLLAGKALAMVFEKPSLRTRCTFELGMVQLGGHAVNLQQRDIGVGQREGARDIARNLERWFDLVMARTFSQTTVDELAEFCRVPVINALSDFEHPCQALADYQTLTEKAGDLKGFHLTYMGDGNNICHSLMLIGAKLGLHVTVSSPEGYEPDASVAETARAEARDNGGSYTLERDPRAAVQDAQAIYTDVWASMGQEDEADKRMEIFRPYQVNAELITGAPGGVLIMHDLPAHRGEEITDEVIDCPNAIVFDQAENRLHAQKAIMVFLHRACR